VCVRVCVCVCVCVCACVCVCRTGRIRCRALEWGSVIWRGCCLWPCAVRPTPGNPLNFGLLLCSPARAHADRGDDVSCCVWSVGMTGAHVVAPNFRRPPEHKYPVMQRNATLRNATLVGARAVAAVAWVRVSILFGPHHLRLRLRRISTLLIAFFACQSRMSMPVCPCPYAHARMHLACLCPHAYARMPMPVCPCPHASRMPMPACMVLHSAAHSPAIVKTMVLSKKRASK
jgi:hypothetical protein